MTINDMSENYGYPLFKSNNQIICHFAFDLIKNDAY